VEAGGTWLAIVDMITTSHNTTLILNLACTLIPKHNNHQSSTKFVATFGAWCGFTCNINF
jgi:hypothetical protein